MDFGTKDILETVREFVGLQKDDVSYDTELIALSESAIQSLNDIGAKCNLTNASVWNDILSDETALSNLIPMMVSYVCLKVKFTFDPPAPSAIQHHNRVIEEYYWRIKTNIQNAEEGGETV